VSEFRKEEGKMAGQEFGGIAEVVGGGLPLSKVTRDSTALMIIDMQYVDAHRDFGLGAAGQKRGWTAEMEYYFGRLEEITTPNIQRLLHACRDADIRVVHVRVMNLAGDSADTSWRYKMFGILVPPGSKDAEIVEELAPLPEEVVLDKTTSNVFLSTPADFALRNMGIDTLIVTGVITNNCVESSTRGASDLGYRVLLVEDGCAAWTQEGHDYCLRHLDRNFALVKSTDEILEEISAVAGANKSGAKETAIGM
jgi:ureidoacrylate peracid hydrolase